MSPDTGDNQLIDDLSRALEEDRLNLLYQPKIRVADGSLERVEALVRWDDPKLGPVSPARFVPVAERHGLIDALTLWGLRTALTAWEKWNAEGIETGVAFNISALSLKSLDFPDLVETYCNDHGMPPGRLILELTEGATQQLSNLMDTLTRFRIKGIGLAIDDFGTGYSSLMQLRQLPFSELKIDRFFVNDAVHSKESRAIIRAIVALAADLGITSTSEGVESDAQLDILRELDCDIAQGFHIARPLEADRLAPWLEEWRTRWTAKSVPA